MVDFYGFHVGKYTNTSHGCVMGCLTEDLSLSKMKHHFVKSMVVSGSPKRWDR